MFKNSLTTKFSYLILAIAISITALLSTMMLIMANSHIPGTSSQYKYYSLGFKGASSTQYKINSEIVVNLQRPHHGKIQIAGTARFIYKFFLTKQNSNAVNIHTELITAYYFNALHVHALYGRLINKNDLKFNYPVMVLSYDKATELFGHARASVGKFMRIGTKSGDAISVKVIGVLPGKFKGVIDLNTGAWIGFTQLPLLSGMSYPKLSGSMTYERFFSLPDMTSILSASKDLQANAIKALLKRSILNSTLSTSKQFKVYTKNPRITGFSAYPESRNLTTKRILNYLYISFFLLFLSVVNLFNVKWLTLIRQRKMLYTLMALGLSRRRMIIQYIRKEIFITIALSVTVLFIYITTFYFASDSVRFNSYTDHAFKQLLNLNSFHISIALTVLAIFIFVLAAEIIPVVMIFFNMTSTLLQPYSISRSDVYIGSSTLIIEVLFATIMCISAVWSLNNTLKAQNVYLGMFSDPASVVNIGVKPASARISSLVGGGVKSTLLIDKITLAIHGIDKHASTAIGPSLGLYLFQNDGLKNQFRFKDLFISGYVRDSTYNWMKVGSVNMLIGRNFDRKDPNFKNVIIDEATAQALFGSVHNSLGKKITIVQTHYMPPQTKHVIGVISSYYPFGSSRMPVHLMIGNIYADPFARFSSVGGTIIISPELPFSLYKTVKMVINSVLENQSSQLYVKSIRSSNDILHKINASLILQDQIFTLIALLAWVIALYGVAAHLHLYLSMRKRLTAILSALGAGPGRLYREVVLGVLALTGAGMGLALLAAPWLAQQFAFLSGTQVSPFGAATWIALAVLLLAVFLVAHFPARRAARTEPAESLHEL